MRVQDGPGRFPHAVNIIPINGVHSITLAR
jgi:hypothetical protein